MKRFAMAVLIFFGSAVGGAFGQQFLNFAPVSQALAALGVLSNVSVVSPPNPTGNWNVSQSNAAPFASSDISHVVQPIQYIVGSGVPGTPGANSYLFIPEASPELTYLYCNGCGANPSLTDNTSRTGVVAKTIEVYQHGQGDVGGMQIKCTADTSLPGATGSLGWLAEPACTGYGADFYANVDGPYLNPLELHMHDDGHAVSMIGPVVNIYRTNSGNSIGQTAGGFIAQSLGTVPIDYWGKGNGPMIAGLNFRNATFTDAPFAAPLITPSSSSAACTAGAFQFDAGFVYVCTATNTWKRAALSTF